VTSFAGLLVIAVALDSCTCRTAGRVGVRLLVTGVVSSALAYLAQTWAHSARAATQTALVFSLEPVWTAFSASRWR